MKVIAEVQITTEDGKVHEPGTTFEVGPGESWLVEQGLATEVKSKKAKTEIVETGASVESDDTEVKPGEVA